ncbi:hypothetical protein [Paenibacillus jiagnxiensis]|uniref:hypothetical protein n=1 Tax=Paenibacillus jiagnxiensis TaxID=3228926 RepID=UPI0033A8C28B
MTGMTGVTGPTGPTVTANNLSAYLSNRVNGVNNGATIIFPNILTNNGTAIQYDPTTGNVSLAPNQTYQATYLARPITSPSGEAGAGLYLDNAVINGSVARVQPVPGATTPDGIANLSSTVIFSTTLSSTLNLKSINLSGQPNDFLSANINVVKLN